MRDRSAYQDLDRATRKQLFDKHMAALRQEAEKMKSGGVAKLDLEEGEVDDGTKLVTKRATHEPSPDRAGSKDRKHSRKHAKKKSSKKHSRHSDSDSSDGSDSDDSRRKHKRDSKKHRRD